MLCVKTMVGMGTVLGSIPSGRRVGNRGLSVTEEAE